jgi:hypothetical protein
MPEMCQQMMMELKVKHQQNKLRPKSIIDYCLQSAYRRFPMIIYSCIESDLLAGALGLSLHRRFLKII